MIATLLIAALVLIVAAPAAAQRKPVISYVDGGALKLYDAELGTDVTAPPITVPGLVPRYSISLDGRYVLWLDDGIPKRLHLHDRASGQEVPLPGVDVYMNPGGLTVSNTGLVGFDDNGNGPALVYDSAAGAFADTGLDAANGHRQTRLSGDGGFLATTCVTDCEVDLGGDASAYVQDLAARTDTGFPDDLTGADDEDEEHPCVNGDGLLIGIDITNPMQRDIFLYDRGAGAVVPLPGLNDPANADTFCVLDATGDHVGYQFDNNEFRVYDRATESLLSLPPRPFASSSTFSAPYPPPDNAAALEIAGGKAKVSRKGVVKVELTCPEEEASPPCSGKLRLETRKRVRFKGRKQKVTLAKSKQYSLGAAEVKKLRLKLGKSRLRLVRKTRAAAKAVAKATVSDAAGNTGTASAKLKLKPKLKRTGRTASAAGTTQYPTVFTKFKYKLKNGEATFKGQIDSSKGGCVPDRKVRLYRQKSGNTDKVGGDRTNNKGKFEIDLGSGPPKNGKYYAEVQQAKIGSATNQKTCLGRTSASVKISG